MRLNITRPLQKLELSPIAQKELKGRVKGLRAYAILTLYLLLAMGLLLLVYINFGFSSSYGYYNSQSRGNVGRGLFYAVVVLQTVLVCLIAPALTANAITGERERQTYDILMTTLLTPRQIVWGKLLSAAGYILLLVFSTLPLFSLAYWIGGVDEGILLMGLCPILVSLMFFTVLGLFISAHAKTTTAAIVLTYLLTLFVLIVLPLIIITLGTSVVYWYASSAGNTSGPDDTIRFILSAIYYVTASMNPVAAFVISDQAYRNTSSFWLMDITWFGGSTSASDFLLPIWACAVFFTLLSLLLWGLTVRKIKRRDKA